MNYDKYEIIRDTREQQGWDFESYDKCKGIIRQKLDTGDYTVCEFSINDLMAFPENSGIPKRRWKYLRLNGKFMWKTLCEFEEKYNVKTLFCGNRTKAEEKVADIFEEVLERLDYEGQQ